MQTAIEQFRENIKRARDFQALSVALASQVTSAVDLSDILRATLVMAVSALDHYVHEVVRLGMLECWRGQRNDTVAFQKFSVSLAGARLVSSGVTSDDWLDYEISVRHGWQSFQHPDKIADAIRLISDSALWEDVGARLRAPATAQDVRAHLDLIVQRRNKIAHEADLDPTYPNTRWPIDQMLVTDAVAFIEELAEVIHQVI